MTYTTKNNFPLVILLFIAFFLSRSVASAATIEAPNLVPNADVRFLGPIEPGDADRLKDIFEQMQANNTQEGGWLGSLANVYFDSPGGSLVEALKIGALLQQYKAASIVGRGHSCLGACAWAFLGGTTRYMWRDGVSRSLESGGKLGFTGLYQSPGGLLENVDIAQLANYATTMDINLSWLARVLALPPGDFAYVQTVNEMIRLEDQTIKESYLPLTTLAVNFCNQATSWRQPLAIDAKSGKNENINVANVVRLSRHEVKQALLSHISKFTTPPKVTSAATQPINAIVSRTAALNDPTAIDQLYRDLEKIGLLDVDNIEPPQAFLVTGWTNQRGFNVVGCIVHIWTEKYSSNDVLLLRTDRIEMRSVIYNDALRIFYRESDLK